MVVVRAERSVDGDGTRTSAEAHVSGDFDETSLARQTLSFARPRSATAVAFLALSFTPYFTLMSSSDSVPQQNTTDLLKNAQFAKAGAGVVPDAAPVSASELLASAYDPARLHPLAGISDQVDYLMLDDDKLTDLPGSDTAIPSRGWSDDLCYGTGTMYLGGMS